MSAEVVKVGGHSVYQPFLAELTEEQIGVLKTATLREMDEVDVLMGHMVRVFGCTAIEALKTAIVSLKAKRETVGKGTRQ